MTPDNPLKKNADCRLMDTLFALEIDKLYMLGDAVKVGSFIFRTIKPMIFFEFYLLFSLSFFFFTQQSTDSNSTLIEHFSHATFF